MNSNGFSSADMSTAAASAHNTGYQAGYADAVKAIEVGKPAAAQEAVAWQRKYIGATRGGRPVDWHNITREEFEQTKSGKWAHKYEVRELYAAPVAAAPVDLHAHLLHMLGAKDHEDAGRIIGELHAASMSTPAAPGIDRDQLGDMLEGMTVSIDVDGLLNTDGRRLFGTVTAVQHDDSEPRGLMLLVQDVQPNWDASPKSGSTEAQDAARYRWLRSGSGATWDQPWVAVGHCEVEWSRQPNEIEGKQLDDAIDAAMQATSAEVGE